MVEKNNATCSICGKGYYLCVSCKDAMKLNPWKMHTDTSEHYKIYQILRGYNTGVYTKEEAKSKLQTVDLSDFDILRDNIKGLINKIMGGFDKPVIENDVKSVVIEDGLNDVVTNVVDNNDSNVLEKEEEKKDDIVTSFNTSRKRKSFKFVGTE